MQETRSRVLLAKPEDYLQLALSVSKTKTFTDCKLKYKFTYIEKLPRKERDYHILGKFNHEILENFYRHIIEGNDEPSNVLMSKVFKIAFENWKSKLTQEQIVETKEFMGAFLQKFAEEKATGKDPKILTVEESFYIDIDRVVLLNGFIDRVQRDHDDVIHVSDYKTTKNKKYLKNDFFQLLTYAFVQCLKDPGLKRVRTSYILIRHNFETIVKEFERDEIMKMESAFLDYAEKIRNEKLFRASPTKLCGWCDHLDICEAGLQITGQQGIQKFGADSW